MSPTFINKRYTFDEIAEWYRNNIKTIPHDPNKLGCSGCLTENQLISLFTGKYYIQERFNGHIVVNGVEGFNYYIFYESDMDHPVDKVKVGKNNVRVFQNFAGRKENTSSSVTYHASEFSLEKPSIEEIYNILNRYLKKPSLHNDNNKAGIIIKNYGTFGPGRCLFGEYLY